MGNELKLHTILVIFSIVIIAVMPHADSYIPPTAAFEKIFGSNQHIEAFDYAGNLTLIGNGISISVSNGTGNHKPTILFNSTNINIIISQKNHTGSITTTNMLTVPTSGLYRISVYQNIVNTDTSGTLSTQIAWTDENSLTHGLNPASDISFVTASNFSQGSIFIDVKSGTNITYQSTVSGVTGTPKYSVFISLEKIG